MEGIAGHEKLGALMRAKMGKGGKKPMMKGKKPMIKGKKGAKEDMGALAAFGGKRGGSRY